MKTIIFSLQVAGALLILVGVGQLFGVMIVSEALEKSGFSITLSFWESWGMLAVGSLAVTLGLITEFIYDAGRSSATDED